MKIKMVCMMTALAGLLLLSSFAAAIDLPTYMEFDLDNWTRLYFTEPGTYHVLAKADDSIIETVNYNAGDLVPVANPSDTWYIPDLNLIGAESRAFVTFNDIAPTQGPDGADLPATWVGGLSDGTYLYGWESGVQVFLVTPDGSGGSNLYFTHDGSGDNEFEVYQSTVTTVDFIYNDPNFLSAGPTAFDTIATNLEAAGTEFIGGTFADSVYYDPYLASINWLDPDPNVAALGFGYILATTSINSPELGTLGGEWVNQINQPYDLGVNAFVDVDPTFGIGAQFQSGFYDAGYAWGTFPWNNLISDSTNHYDLAIQNVRLNSELGGGIATLDEEGWIISDDGVRAGEATRIPEPATMLLLGTGLVGLAGGARKRSKK